MTRRIDQDAEERILNGLSKMAGLVNDGVSPSDALHKVASEDDLSQGQVRLMANAYNTGRTTKQRTSGLSVLDKSAEFHLADADDVLSRLFPDRVKTAAEIQLSESVSSEYDSSPHWLEKAAFAGDHDPEELLRVDVKPYPKCVDKLVKRARNAQQVIDRERDERRLALGESYDRLDKLASAIVDYFRDPESQPFEDVVGNSEAAFGKAASTLFTKLSEECCKPIKVRKGSAFKDAPMETRTFKLNRSKMDKTASPYREVGEFISETSRYKSMMAEFEQFEKDAVEVVLRLEHALHPPEAIAPAADLSILRRLAGEKRAFVPGAGNVMAGAQFGLGTQAAGSIMKQLSPKTDEAAKQTAYDDLTDPSHESKLRAIRTQATLHGMLNSPYFQGEDPRHVTDLFNQVNQLAPRVAEQPLVLESTIRRLMSQGQADNHDLDQLLGMEVNLKKRNEPGRSQEPEATRKTEA